MKNKIQVFDPPMCCSTGVCGPSVDPALVRFASDLEYVKKLGAEIERYNLSQQPQMFVGNPLVKGALDEDENCLPLIIVDGKIVSKGKYPPRDVLASYVGIEVAKSMCTEAVQELVAIGAAIASNCETCFRYHLAKAQKLGVSQDDIILAVDIANDVKSVPARSITNYAKRLLGGVDNGASQASSCCSPGEGNGSNKKSCC